MNQLTTKVLSAVAYHPTMLFIPVELAGMNIAINVALMLISLYMFDLSPVIWLFTIIGAWVAMAIAHSRDPHGVQMLKAIGTFKRNSINLVPTDDGVKYVP